MAKITVITVVFNGKERISKTMDSILAQECSDFEYLIIDGGSLDGTTEIISQYENRIKDKGISFKWQTKKDEGLYDAMNKGSKKASGDWLLFLNAGDELYDNNVIGFMKDFLSSTKACIVYGDVCSVDAEREYIMHSDKDCRCIKKSSAFCHQGAFINRAVQVSNPYNTRYKLAADYDFFLKLYLNGFQFQYVDKVISRFLLDGASNNNRRKLYMEYDSIWKENGIRKGIKGKILSVWGYFKIMVADVMPDKLVYAIMSKRING